MSQVISEFRFGDEISGKVFSGVGQEKRVQDLSPDSGFNYEKELQQFFDWKRSEDKSYHCTIG